MPRPKSVIPLERIEFLLRADLAAKLKLQLFSELEGRIPYGEMSRLLTQLVAEYLGEAGELQLAPYFPEFPPGASVRGDRAVIEALENLLKLRNKESLA